LANEQGIVASYTAGANVAAALKLADALTPDELIVTIACDTGMKYLSADLFEQPSKSESNGLMKRHPYSAPFDVASVCGR